MTKRLSALFLALCMLLPCLAFAEEEIVIPEMTVGSFDIPDNEAMAFLRRMGLGWNLGNTLDASSGWTGGNELNTETSWGNPRTTPELFQAIHDAGFGFVRIPITWSGHLDADFTIHEVWLDRVQEIVDAALDAGLIVLINTHHDVSEKYYYPDRAHEETSRAFVERIWAQVAERFADYDERLVFESLNEPRLKGTIYEWSFNPLMLEVKEAAECINELNQLFVDTVRAAGGYNEERYLSVPGYAASIDGCNPDYFVLPTDTADNKLIVAVHAYTPYSFALDTKGTAEFDMDKPGDRSSVMLPLKAMYDRWISKGIPAYIGEYGSLNKDNLQARVDHVSLYASAAMQWNIPIAWWDNGSYKGNGENFAIINRRTLEWYWPELIEAMMRYSLQETEAIAE
ncbi:MAG: glycoside hydrolase family 5 protein [Clostridia bacterium]|nr:glycoside hydrolase family 5 protein [Clostridia bacterium]